jgi:hypothetical protein
VTSFKGGTRKLSGWTLAYPATLFACFLTFAHRFFAALTIAALPQPTGRAARTSKLSLATIC